MEMLITRKYRVVCIDDAHWNDNSLRYEHERMLLNNRFYSEAFSRQVILVVSVSRMSFVPELYQKLEYFGKVVTLKPPSEEERRELLVFVD